MKKNYLTLLWILTAIVAFLLLNYLLPATLFESLGWFICAIIGLIVAMLIFFAILQIQNVSEIFYRDISKNDILIPAVVLIFCSIFSSKILNDRLEKYIKKNGIKTEAVITKGYESNQTTEITRISGTNRTTVQKFSLTLSFTTKEGVSHTVVSNDIDEEVYYSVSLNKTVEIIYLPENINIFRIIAGEKNQLKYTGKKPIQKTQKKPKNIEFSDINDIILFKNKYKLLSKLKTIDSNWVDKNSSEGFEYQNNQTLEEILVFPLKNRMFYARRVFKNNTKYIFENEKIVNSIKNDSSSTTFELKKYFINATRKDSEPEDVGQGVKISMGKDEIYLIELKN
jgi:hypothetical protein